MALGDKKVLVVGAGFAGLATAALLARQGFEVVVLEKNDRPGGRAQVYEKDGFRFDMGPSWYLMPDIFERFFRQFGREPSDFYELRRLDPSYRVFFGPDDWVDVSSDFEDNVRLFESHEAGAGERLREYVRVAEYQYRAAIGEFLYKDYRSLFDFFTRKTMVEGRKLHVFESLDKYAKRFFKSERLRRILEYSMVFLGGSPSNTPAMYSLMSHVDFNLGVWYPDGGIGSVVRALQTVGEQQGVRYEFGSEVRRIAVEGSRAVAVETVQGTHRADAVVVAADYAHAELNLLDEAHRTYGERFWRKRTWAPSALLMYLGLDQPVPKLLHHTLSFEHDWVEHFDAIFRAPAWPDKPSYYLCCPTKTDPSVAPPGHENLVVLVPVASGLQDDNETRERFADQTLEALEGLVGTSVRDSIVCKTIFSQRDFANVFNAHRGTALGLSHTLLQTAVFRPSQRSKRVSNLYYAGQYTHPGIGLPMALISAEIAASIVQKEQGRHGPV